MSGISSFTTEYKRAFRYRDEPENLYPYNSRYAAIVPAAKYLRTYIDAYKSLKRIPIVSEWHRDPEYEPPPKHMKSEEMIDVSLFFSFAEGRVCGIDMRVGIRREKAPS